ncbi:hypothetical protein [Bacterioplanoides sp.]|uniref:hypothetical protein n=1 Tax=Bacterioplanoides sp. TaxID=2066072 RepID=UPI003B5B67FE
MTPQADVCRSMIEQALDFYGLPDSESAVRLLCMIAAHESGKFLYTRQHGGPAIGAFQMEPATYEDVSLYARKKGYMTDEFPSPPERMIFDFWFATGMARIFFLRLPAPLPAPHQLKELAVYAKKYWNTELGKATPDMYLSAYRDLFDEK